MAKLKLGNCLFTIPASREARNLCRVVIAVPAILLFGYLWSRRKR